MGRQTLKHSGGMFQNLLPQFLTKSNTNNSRKKTKMSSKQSISAIVTRVWKDHIEPICVFLRSLRNKKISLPSLYKFVVLLLVTIIRIQEFPGISMYRSVIFVMLHQFIVNGVENISKFAAVKNIMSRTFSWTLFAGNNNKSSSSAPETSDAFIGEKNSLVATLLTEFASYVKAFSDQFTGTDPSIVNETLLSNKRLKVVFDRLAKLVMSLLVLMLIFYLLEYFFPPYMQNRRIITPYIHNLPIVVKEVLSRLMGFLQEKISVLREIKIDWNMSSISTSPSSSNFFYILFSLLFSDYVSKVFGSFVFQNLFEETVQKIQEQTKDEESDDDDEEENAKVKENAKEAKENAED